MTIFVSVFFFFICKCLSAPPLPIPHNMMALYENLFTVF